ncbi:MAG: DUF1800 domain-containing protein [Dinghuibacter sp.]|nr:DUF1800 domain-containing protein [Dinghuibacter sp.]
MPVSNQLKNQHLLWRAGFGVSATDIPTLSGMRTEDLVKKIMAASAEKPAYIDVAENAFQGMAGGLRELVKMKKEMENKEDRQKLQKLNREGIRNLNLTWLKQMWETPAQLREKMSLFWHGHFACRVINVYYQQLLLDGIRQNALGNFGDLLRAVSRSAAMINFLNNQQNRKKHPNENFAREVMELFTLGRGNYTENDVKEAARAFTGWGANFAGEFVFRANQHDDDTKTILGKTGRFNGDDVINLLLEQKQTARYITGKLWRFLVNEQKADKEKINWLADRFYNSNYDIQALLRDIFSASWFYDSEHIGSKIKSPVELLAGIHRVLPMKLENEDVLLNVQRALGQTLFFPPNVAGWPGGRQWIDSSTLILRLRMPRLIFDAEEFAVRPKDDDDVSGGMEDKTQMNKLKRMAGGRIIRAQINWEQVEQPFAQTDMAKLGDTLTATLLQTPAVSFSRKLVTDHSGDRSRLLRNTIINIMSTPEYQLC